MTTTIRTLKIAPGPQGYPLFGSLPDFRRDPLTFYLNAQRQFGDVIRFRGGPWRWYLLAHPDDVKHVLQDNHPNYRKGRFYDLLRPTLGEGLLTSEGRFWLQQRRLAQPAFHRQRLASFATTMTDATARMLERWQVYARSGEPFNVAAEMMRLTLEVVGGTLFSTDVTGEAEAVGRALTVVIEYVNDLETRLFPLPPSIPTPANRRYRAAQRTLDEVVRHVIDERRRAGTDRGDLLSMLLLAQDEETGASMNDRQLRDEVMTIFLAGHETTANALAWTWYLLSKHPSAGRRLHAELADMLGGRRPTVEDLPRLNYARMVIEEALRLYPPVWGFGRQAITDDEVGGYFLPANSLVVLSPYVTHRHPDFWENPEGFDPQRFMPQHAAARPRFAHFPFSGGPRQCIGNAFAMMEAQLILAMVAQRYRLDLVPGHSVEAEPTVTLRPRHGILVTLHEQAGGGDFRPATVA
ncbi:MAG: cytochrome P450 [Ardenticatenaceae bacterium]|nr:cytochrome P450 [Ardenticatenaceae bacterium]